jgi:hypothetical protein
VSRSQNRTSTLRRFRRRRVALIDGLGDSFPGLLSIQASVLLDCRRYLGEFFILDDVAKPTVIVTRPKVMLPCAIIKTVSNLCEQD